MCFEMRKVLPAECDLLSDRNRDQMEAALVSELYLKIPIVLHLIWIMQKI